MIFDGTCLDQVPSSRVDCGNKATVNNQRGASNSTTNTSVFLYAAMQASLSLRGLSLEPNMAQQNNVNMNENCCLAEL
jgi:hypothetical protein